MGYKPTIGGLEKLQEFLAENGFSMPNFYMDLVVGGILAPEQDWDIRKKLISLEEAKRLHGANAEVDNVRIASVDGSSFIHFGDPVFFGIFTTMKAFDLGMDVVILTGKNDVALNKFLSSEEGSVFLDIARWGEPWPSFFDRIKFRWRARSSTQTTTA